MLTFNRVNFEGPCPRITSRDNTGWGVAIDIPGSTDAREYCEDRKGI